MFSTFAHVSSTMEASATWETTRSTRRMGMRSLAAILGVSFGENGEEANLEAFGGFM
jgi:hypothetical protein